MTLGEVLEAVHRGRHNFTTMQAAVREWRDFERGRSAFSRVMGRSGTPPSEAELVDRAPTFSVTHSLVWVRRPSKMRLERVLGPSGDPSLGGRAITVVDGERWWSYHPSQGFSSSEEEGVVPEPHTTFLRQLLDPWALLGHLALEVGEETELAGRPAIRLRGTPEAIRHRTTLPGLGQGADAYELTVDRDHGVLLRTAAKIDGEEFEVKEMGDVAFDLEIGDDVFPFPSAG